jgi:hypothetical protein
VAQIESRKFEFIINLQTARIDIPLTLPAIADEVIE